MQHFTLDICPMHVHGNFTVVFATALESDVALNHNDFCVTREIFLATDFYSYDTTPIQDQVSHFAKRNVLQL